MYEPEQGSDSELMPQPNLSTPESSGPSYQDIGDQSSFNDLVKEFDPETAPLSEFENAEGDDTAITAEVASPINMGFDDPVSSDNMEADADLAIGTGTDADLAIGTGTDADLAIGTGTDADLVTGRETGLATGTDADLVTGTETDLATRADADLATGRETGLADPSLETNLSTPKSITIEITKEKLDELLTKISEETINYLSLLIKFMEKKSQFDTNNEKINKIIKELTKIKDDIIKILTENEITSNGFDPTSSAQKSQYAEMIMAALGIAAAVTGGKRSKSKKRVKKHKKTKNIENKHYNHKTKKHRRKKSKTKGQMIKINNDQVNKENN
jgi:hypothetical protein